MAVPQKPKDFLNGDFGKVSDNAPVVAEVMARIFHVDDVLSVTVTSGQPFFAVSSLSSASLELTRDPDGPHGAVASWEESIEAESDGGAQLPVGKGQRIHVEVTLAVPRNLLPAGILQGSLSIKGAHTSIVVGLRASYTPASASLPPPQPGPGPIPLPNPVPGPGPVPLPNPNPQPTPEPSGADCARLLTDLANDQVEMQQLQQRLRSTGGPDGPGTPRDQIKQVIALLQSEMDALEATIVENGCNLHPTGGPKSLVFDSPVYGPVTLSARVLEKWVACRTLTTVAGQAVQDFLGLPIRPTRFVTQASRMLDVQEFEHGAIINVEGSGMPFVVYGAIYSRYRHLGGWDGFLGAPKADEVDASVGRLGAFEGGDIYWDPVGGTTHEVHGAILQRWTALHGPSGPLGFPVTDELSVQGDSGEIGRYQLFQRSGGLGSAIYFSPATGASEVLGDILSVWLKDHAGPTGDLGFPTGTQAITPRGTAYHTFQNGIVVQVTGKAPVVLIGGLELRLQRYIVDDDFNVQIRIDATTGQDNHGRMPADGQYDGGSKTFGPDTLLSVPAVGHGAAGIFVPPDMRIDIWMEAISERTIGSDDRKGTITQAFDIDTAWGLQDAIHSHKDGAFEADFFVRAIVQPPVTDSANFRREAFWPFGNFDTDPLSWAQFEKTFSDVKETDKHINLNPLHLNLHIAEIVLYETLYRGLAKAGNCFGMCLESVYARAGRSIFSEPIFSSNSYVNDGYPSSGDNLDPSKLNSREVGDEINVKHGYQIGGEFVWWFLGKWTAGALHDPVRAFRDSRDSDRCGDWPLLTVSTRSALSQDAHVLIPYQWIGDTAPIQRGQTWEILCANPNSPFGKTPNGEDSHCKVVIHPFEQEFEFHFGQGSAADDIWTGSDHDGGRLLMVPFSRLASQPRSLGDEIFALLSSAVLIVFGDSGEASQVTDEAGRTLFAQARATGAAGVPNPDKASRIPNLIPVAHCDASAATPGAEVYLWSRDDGPLRGQPATDISNMEMHWDVRSAATGNPQIVVRSATGLTSIRASGGLPAGHRISLIGLGSAAQRIVLHGGTPASGTTTRYAIETAGWYPDLSTPTWFSISTELAAGQQLHFHAGHAGTQLTLHSPTHDAKVDLTLRTRAADPNGEPVSLSRSGVALPMAQVARIEPATWHRDSLPSATVSRAVIAAFGSSKVLRSTNI